jgi:hypothetical protein
MRFLRRGLGKGHAGEGHEQAGDQKEFLHNLEDFNLNKQTFSL